ncbi:hypothetical protein A8G06_07755 [Escherichia coli]|nr:hypothetical protein A8G06_07755 [Escherichia coli]OWE37062.1 hypothetical protein A8G07_16785 [Escherichia coli]
MTVVRLPDALRLSGLRGSCNILILQDCVGRIRRLRRIWQLCADARCDAGASYHAYETALTCRLDKAFTPHPA